MAAGTPKKLDSEGLWSYALRSLAGRAHSISELREKLRDFPSQALVRCHEESLGVRSVLGFDQEVERCAPGVG